MEKMVGVPVYMQEASKEESSAGFPVLAVVAGVDSHVTGSLIGEPHYVERAACHSAVAGSKSHYSCVYRRSSKLLSWLLMLEYLVFSRLALAVLYLERTI